MLGNQTMHLFTLFVQALKRFTFEENGYDMPLIQPQRGYKAFLSALVPSPNKWRGLGQG